MNVQLGYALLRDRRVPLRPKLIALAIGAAVVGFTELLEAIFGPVLIATLLLPYLAPDPVVQQIRAERARPV